MHFSSHEGKENRGGMGEKETKIFRKILKLLEDELSKEGHPRLNKRKIIQEKGPMKRPSASGEKNVVSVGSCLSFLGEGGEQGGHLGWRMGLNRMVTTKERVEKEMGRGKGEEGINSERGWG